MTMENMENKKLALLYILKILEEYSDYEHPLKQKEIIDKLEHQYGLIIERKAVSRNLSLLQEADYGVDSYGKGYYLKERDFDDTELRMMIDAVLSSRYIAENQAKDLADRIAKLSNKYFRSHVKHIHLLSKHDKTDKQDVFWAIECIDEAIEKGRQISFDYDGYSFDEKLTRTHWTRMTVSPIQMVMKNQFYYLIAAAEVPVFGAAKAKDPSHPMVQSFRLDLISNPLVEEEHAVDPQRLKKYGQEIDVKQILSTNPYMNLRGNTVRQASFICFRQELDLVVENLGKDLKIKPLKVKDTQDTKELELALGKQYLKLDLVKVSLKIAVEDLVEFACRYPQKIFIVSPADVADRQEQLYRSHLALAEEIKAYDE